MKTIGIILVVVGIAMLAWSGFTYTTKENVVDMGPIQVDVEKEEKVEFPPYAGIIAAGIGLVLIVMDKKK